MYCQECGTDVAAGAAVCPECGATVTSAPRQGEAMGAEESREATGSQHNPSDEPEDSETRQEQSGGTSRADEAHSNRTQGLQAGDNEGHHQQDGQVSRGAAVQRQAQGQSQQQPPQQRSPQGQPRATGGGGGSGPGGSGGSAGGYGGGYRQSDAFDFASLVDTLPLVPGVVAGSVSGIIVFAIGLVLAILMPAGFGSGLERGASLALDLQFGTPRHLTPMLYGNFDIVRPPDATLGVLYLVAPLLLYKASKLVVGFGLDESASLQGTALGGVTIILGYLPVMLVAALVVPSSSSTQFSLVTAVGMAGLVYPLVFGALGGLSAGYFSLAERRVGILYGVVGFLAVYVGLFATSYVYINIPNNPFVTALDRLLAVFVTLAQVHELSFGTPQDARFIPYVVVALLVAAIGFVRVYRSDRQGSPVESIATALTPAVTYGVLFGLVTSVTVVFADSYIQDELGLGLLLSGMAQALAASVPTIGEYIRLVFMTVLVFPVFVGSIGGAAAWYIQSRQRSGY